MKCTVLLIAFSISVTAIAIGQSMSQSSEHGFFQTQDIKWMDGPASLPKGSKVALLEGNQVERLRNLNSPALVFVSY